GPNTLIFMLGGFSPGIVAMGRTGLHGGRPAVVALLRRLIDWDVPARWFVFAAAYMLAIKLTAALIHRIAFGAWPTFGQEPVLLMIAATIASTMMGGQAGEELGWRGYALPRLASRFGLGPASILLGVIWALWHLPLFFAPVGDTFSQSFPLYLLQVIAISVAMAFLYSHTRGSLLPVMLLHAAVNNTKDIVPSVDTGATNPWALSHSTIAWLTLAVLWLCGAYFLIRMPRTGLRAPAQ
ncbi:MAG TPA: CPBP family intramembrane glutamic endopeptidase, partial [Vicinamibacterales bacterium]|nr:CPBP family intramembrane glutamic endopeptidase [Vicinamibacterales bacterium]